jgi:hypothetical protein
VEKTPVVVRKGKKGLTKKDVEATAAKLKVAEVQWFWNKFDIDEREQCDLSELFSFSLFCFSVPFCFLISVKCWSSRKIVSINLILISSFLLFFSSFFLFAFCFLISVKCIDMWCKIVSILLDIPIQASNSRRI